jgi:AraC family transcriptional regulator of adaptative response/methylated-DNA-[protein]-cysteine methyltransferase
MPKIKLSSATKPPAHVRWGIHGYVTDKGLKLNLMIGLGDTNAICRMSFLRNNSKVLLLEWQNDWPQTTYVQDVPATAAVMKCVASKTASLNILLVGTGFQHKVWQALATIPSGHVLTYGDVAQRIKNPKASRAVGGACGRNRVTYLIPCHRVIAGDGRIGGFSSDPKIKRDLLRSEGVRLR